MKHSGSDPTARCPLTCGVFHRVLLASVEAGSLASSWVGFLPLLRGSANELPVEWGGVTRVSCFFSNPGPMATYDSSEEASRHS